MKRFAIIAATLAAAVLAGLGVAAPAQATPNQERYVAITSMGDQLRGWFWVDQIDGIIGCPRCVHWLDFRAERKLTPQQEVAVKGGIMAGLGQLSEATVAPDARTRDQLRADALAQFSSAARALGGLGLRAGPVGYYNPDKGVTVTTGAAWLNAADQDIVDGIGLLQSSFGTTRPQGLVASAVAEFDQAFAQISAKKALAG